MVQTTLAPEKLAEVERFAKRLREAGIPYESLIVFGSYAKKDAKPWSDIDVCVVSKIFGQDRHTERMLLMHLTDDTTIDIEAHPYHPRDLADAWDPLASEIRRFGIRVDVKA